VALESGVIVDRDVDRVEAQMDREKRLHEEGIRKTANRVGILVQAVSGARSDHDPPFLLRSASIAEACHAYAASLQYEEPRRSGGLVMLLSFGGDVSLDA
jgi:hypothetical protein